MERDETFRGESNLVNYPGSSA